jgi:prepilin-type N-terminal cleavage/methylation domain-containing protein
LKLNSYPPTQFDSRLARTFQRGVTLIELMVALVLALLIIAAVGYVYLQGSQGFRVQDSQSRMQEDARFIIDTVGRDVRVAGAFGCNLPRETGAMLSGKPSTSVEVIATQPIMTAGTAWLMTSGDDTTPTDRFTDLQYVLRGFSPAAAATAAPLPAYIQGASRQPNTDVLMIMRAGEDSRSVTSSTETTVTMDGYLSPPNTEFSVLAVSDCRQTKIIKPDVSGPPAGPVVLSVANIRNINKNAPSGEIGELRAAFGKNGTPTVSHFEPVLYFVKAPVVVGSRPTLQRVGISTVDAATRGLWDALEGASIASGVESFNLSFVLSGDPTVPKEFNMADMEANPSRWAVVTAVRLQFTLSAESDGTALTAQSNVAGGPVRADNRLVQRYDVTLGVSSRQNPRN